MSEPLTWQNLWDAMEASPAEWIPTTEKMYWDMLEVLPPRKMTHSAFLVGEPLSDNGNGEAVYSCFCRTGDQYKARNLTVKQFIEYFH
jgi:hypothetical protein